MVLREELVDPSYEKDYDALEEEGLARWLKQFDTSCWCLFLAREEAIPVGEATVAFRTAGLHMLGGREDIAVLWDIRVRPDHWRRGVGSALFAEVIGWSRERNCTHMKIETQNTNVTACHFYAAQGCRLGEINRFAYK
jgi:GNAT superfamily N-acetyltransferase